MARIWPEYGQTMTLSGSRASNLMRRPRHSQEASVPTQTGPRSRSSITTPKVGRPASSNGSRVHSSRSINRSRWPAPQVSDRFWRCPNPLSWTRKPWNSVARLALRGPEEIPPPDLTLRAVQSGLAATQEHSILGISESSSIAGETTSYCANNNPNDCQVAAPRSRKTWMAICPGRATRP